MAVIEFTDNYQDLSTDQGFQFKFHCERCGDGFMSSFQTNTLGVAGSLLRGAGGLLGGILGQAAASTYEVQRAIGGPQHDAALRAAIAEVKPLFQKCRRCGNWLCAQTCWNAKAGLCKQCAPDRRGGGGRDPLRARAHAGDERPVPRREPAHERQGQAGRGAVPRLRRAHAGQEVLSVLREEASCPQAPSAGSAEPSSAPARSSAATVERSRLEV